MTLPDTVDRHEATQLRDLLRHWRDVRGKSQFDLSLDCGISQRHISFIESGKSAPSRETLMLIAQALDVPLRERNALLLAAGFAPIYGESPWNAHEMQGIERALQRMLKQQEPYPAVVMDRHWNVLMSNDASPRFFSRFVDLSRQPSPRNLLRLMFDPHGMRPFIANWQEAGRSLLQRLHRESTERVLDARSRALLSELLAFTSTDPDWQNARSLQADPIGQVLPMVPLTFVKEGFVLSLFSMVTTVGAPQAVAAQELRLECMFPVDDASAILFERFMKEDDTGRRAANPRADKG
jgi:transcriptional regulator with XRE-family HTH domain